MSARESRLAVVLLAFLGVSGAAFFGYQFYWLPMQLKSKRIDSMHEDIEKQSAKLKSIRDSLPRLKALTAVSLPADETVARKEYEDELSKMLRKSGLENVTVIPKEPDRRTVPMFASKKPIYTKLAFQVTARGDVASVVDWLEKFYRTKTLHQVRNLSLAHAQRTEGRGRDGGDLDVTATIEAIILDKAEARKTLLPEKVPDKIDDYLPRLAKPDRQYASVAGKNIFFGPPPPPPRDSSNDKRVDSSPYIKLDSITVGPGGAVATLFDAYSNHDYLVKPRALGGFNVTVSYYVNGRKRPLRSDREIVVTDENNEEHKLAIIRIDDRDLILRDEDYHYYKIHVGQTLSDMHQLTKEELAAMGIKEETKPTTPADEP